ncbi:biosynthetic-type acetolactate synthase large subunit [Candidatus Gracilibacteria bacterium]|nr:biosynthetic-type acetolactate synthase large subunit [Candidatus Gracilibacteria bacterium]
MTNSPSKLGSDLFCEALADAGVELMFGIPGGVVLPLYDKINKYGHHIRHILPRNEQGGGFAADGYARATGKTGVALGTSGPGATNLMTAITNSYMDSIPVVYITGQVGEDFIGTDAFQETDVIGMSMPVVKHSYLITKAEDIPRIVREAFYLANSGRPGPVHIDIVKDVWFHEISGKLDDTMDLPGYSPLPEVCSDSEIEKLNKLLEKPDCKPVIFAGHGIEISKAQKELQLFAEKHNIPVISTLLGLGSFPQGHELWAGMIGMHGDAVANYMAQDANLLIGIGCRWDDRITGKLESFIQDTTFVHIEIDASEINKIVPTELPLLGDAKEVLGRANKILTEHKFPEWNSQMSELKEKYGFLDFTINPENDTPKLSQARLLKMLSDTTDGQAIVASDVGRHQMWTGRFYRFAHANSHLSSGGLGTMGYGMSAAMGASLGSPDREVWTITGDGGFKMNIQELGTLAEYKIPVKIAIMEDNALGMVRQWQTLLFKGNHSHSEFSNPDFVMLAKSYGIPGARAKTYEEAQAAIDEARNTDGPFLIVFEVDPDEHVYPMVPPATALGDQALCDADLLKDDTNKYNEDDLLQGHT